MTYIKLLEAAIEAARDVCKYIDAGMVEEAKAHTEFFWDALDKIDEAEKQEPVSIANVSGYYCGRCVVEPMNERIRELMKQTGVPVSMPFDKWCEKFADLIVRECIDICDKTADDARCYYEGAATCIDNIKQHFGVES